MKTGLIVGKFYPPTTGHQYLIQQAEKQVDELLIVVGSLPTETIKAFLRVHWLEQLVGKNTKVFSIPDNNPEGITSDNPEYWEIWKKNLTFHLPYIPNILFGGDDYLNKLAKVLEIEYIPIDPKRTKFSITATKVRNDPKKYWDFIPDIVKPYYEKI